MLTSSPCDMCPLWHNKHVFSGWSDYISTPAKSPPPLQTNPFCVSNRQDILNWRWLISSTLPPQFFKVQLRWHSSPLPYNYQSRSCISEDRKCFYWWVEKHLKPFAVVSAMKSQITLKEEISLLEIHLPTLCAYSLVWMQNIAHWKPGFVIPGFWIPNFLKTHIVSLGVARHQSDQCIHFISTKKFMHFDLWSIDYHICILHECLSSLFSEIVIISPVKRSFQDTRNSRKPWSIQ
jgi:hypothetical protein